MFWISNEREVSINIFLFKNQMGQKALIPNQTKVWVCLWKEELSCLEVGPNANFQKDGILIFCVIGEWFDNLNKFKGYFTKLFSPSYISEVKLQKSPFN